MRLSLLIMLIMTLGGLSCDKEHTAPPPVDTAALAGQANTAYEAEDFARCADLFAQVATARPADQDAAYNGACCAARAGDADRAFRLLHDAVARGWRDVKWLNEDTDLASLRGDRRWAALMEAAGAAERAFLERIDVELYRMYQEDQADRSGGPDQIDWSKVAPRDADRRRRVHEKVARGPLGAAEDYYHAAMILQHGEGPEDYKLAHELAAKAAELDARLDRARWLSAAAEDRWLQSTGKPQIWGTQYKKDAGGKWTMDPIDEGARTDEQRRAQKVPTLAEAKQRMEAMNRKP